MSTPHIKIILVDDHPMLRAGVKQMLEFESYISVIGEASSGKEALALVKELEPDLVLLDMNMPNMNGIQTIQGLRSRGYTNKILMFTVSNDPNEINQAIRAGANGYLLKDMEPEQIAPKIRSCFEEESKVSEDLNQITEQYLEEKSQSPMGLFNTLSNRERDVLRLIADGLSNKEIARDLQISEGTVKVHVKHVLTKMKKKSRLEIAVWAVENQIQHY